MDASDNGKLPGDVHVFWSSEKTNKQNGCMIKKTETSKIEKRRSSKTSKTKSSKTKTTKTKTTRMKTLKTRISRIFAILVLIS